VSEDLPLRITLEEMELPPCPGSLLRVTVNDEGHGGFFGPDGPCLGWGYSVRVNGELWRGILETVRAVGGGSEITVRIEGRYGG